MDAQRKSQGVGTSFVADSAAALLSSATYTTTFYPFHRIKTLLQTQDSNPAIMSGKVARFNFATAFPRIIKEQGFFELWRGNLPYMLRHVPSTTLSFAFKDTLLQHVFPHYDPSVEAVQYMATRVAAGGLAGVMALALVYPMDFATIRMAADVGPRDSNMLETLAHTTRQRGGVMGLYRGFPLAATAIGAYKALYFGLYDIAKTYAGVEAGHSHKKGAPTSSRGKQGSTTDSSSSSTVTPPPKRVDRLPLTAFSLDGTGVVMDSSEDGIASSSTSSREAEGSGISVSPSLGFGIDWDSRMGHLLWSWILASGVVYVATTVTYPLDVVRKRMVVDSASAGQQYKGVWDCMKKIAAKEGMRGFYRFYGYDMILRFGGGLLLVLYDEVRGVTRQAVVTTTKASS